MVDVVSVAIVFWVAVVDVVIVVEVNSWIVALVADATAAVVGASTGAVTATVTVDMACVVEDIKRELFGVTDASAVLLVIDVVASGSHSIPEPTYPVLHLHSKRPS